MNESLQNELDRLTIELKERRRYYRRSLRNMLVLSAVVLIFFALYSALAVYKIREFAAPQTAALLIADQFRGKYLDPRSWTHSDYRRFAEDATQSVLLSLPTGIYAAGEALKDSMRQDARMAAVSIADGLTLSVFRALERIGSESVEESAEKILAETGVEQLTASGKTLMFPVPFAFGARLREIRMKNGRTLTRQDLCDRDFAVCWLYFSENGRYQDGRCRNLMNLSLLLVRSWAEAAGGDFSTAQKKTKNSPVSRNSPVRQ